MKRIGICVIGALMAASGAALATSTTIGTATYMGSEYNLIWDDDNNGNSLVWLDYSAPPAHWPDQMAWAAGLEAQLTYNLDPGCTVTWSDTSWRLPDAGSSPLYGFQAATQELGHLYYDELGFTGGSSNGGATAPDLASSVFENLALSAYWTSTVDDIDYGFFVVEAAWMFAFMETRSTPYNDTVYGFQDIDARGTGMFSPQHRGLAVRSGEVVTSPQGPMIPEPMTMLAVACGLAGLGAYTRRDRRMA